MLTTDRAMTMGLERPEPPATDGAAYFEVTGEMLAALFLFPAGCVIDAIREELDRPYTFTVRVRSPQFPKRREGFGPIPRIDPMYSTQYVSAGTVAPCDCIKTTLVDMGLER